MDKVDADPPRPVPPRRRVRWRLLAIVLGCLPFLILETTLRLIGIPASQENVDQDPLVDLHQLKPLFELSADSQHYVIPESRYNFFRPASFPAEKSALTKRIFVLGGSTVQGRPYATESAFSTWLQLALESADSEVESSEYEVINCGGVSYASYRVAKILDEVLRYEPDAIVLYTGHNEFLEDRTYAEVKRLGPVRKFITKVGSVVHTVRWLQHVFASPSVNAETANRTEMATEVDTRLDHEKGMQSYHRDSPWHDAVTEHFEMSLRKMVVATKGAGIPLIVCVPVSEIVNTPPHKIEALKTLPSGQQVQFEEAWERACNASESSTDRISAAKDCLSIDRLHAGANYILGRLLLEAGDAIGARTHLVLARDNDVCPLRATSRIMQAVRDVALEHEIHLIETPALFDQASMNGLKLPDQIPDKQLFADHLHPTIAGHQIIGQRIADVFQDIGWIKRSSVSEARYAQKVGQHLESLDESYFARGKQRLEGLLKWASGRAGDLGVQAKE